jgi:Ran GTPase-activating protein (RanGAP) involved in mRNA processing and transport
MLDEYDNESISNGIDRHTFHFSFDRVNYDTKNGIDSSSPWKKLLESLDPLESSGVDPDTVDKVQILEVAKKFADRLKKDMILLDKKNDVTECAVICPSWGTHYDKTFSICSFIAPLIFPKKDDSISDSDHEIAIYNKYSRYLSKLRTAYKQQLKYYKDIEEKFRRLPTKNGRRFFKELMTLPYTESLIEPKWSPTAYSKPTDLEPIIKFIRDDCKLEKESMHFTKGSIHIAHTDDGYRLDLCDQGLDVKMLDDLFNALKTNNNITHVLIGNNMINDEGAKIISDFIKNHAKNRKKKISTWYLCACGFTASGMKLICDALSTDTDVKGLWLKRNPLKIEGNKLVADLIKTNKSIKVLDLVNTAMTDEGCEYLFNALKENKTIDSLFIGINCLTHKSAKYISEYFEYLVERKLVGIENLYFEMNRFDDIGIIEICKSLKQYKHLVRLGAESVRISHEGAKAIFDTFVDRDNFLFLGLGMCKATIPAHELPNNITDAGIDYVCDFIEKNKSIQVLNVQHNGFSEASVDKLIDSYEKNESLLKLFSEQAGCRKVSRSSKLFTLMNERIKKKFNMDEREFSRDLSRMLCTGDYIKDAASIYFNGR